MDDDRLVDLLVLRADRPSTFGNIYLGRITALRPGLDAAFVDIGGGLSGFLSRDDGGSADLIEGMRVVARVTREPFDDKGPRLKVLDEGAAAAFEKDLRPGQAPGLLSGGLDLLRELASREPQVEAIWADQSEAVVRLKSATLAERPDLAAKVRWAPHGVDLFEEEGLESEIDGLLEPRVDLPSGGFLLIEPVRSMTPIDVNSGRYQGSQQAMQTNREAAVEISRQLRLRSISGLVVVDFLELKQPNRQRSVLEGLKKTLRQDPVTTRVLGLRPSGLLELTRQRVQPSLHEVLTAPCGLGGSGRTKSSSTLGYEALRAVHRAVAGNPGPPSALRAPARVIDALRGSLRPAVQFIENRMGHPLVLEPRDASDSADFEVVIGSFR